MTDDQPEPQFPDTTQTSITDPRKPDRTDATSVVLRRMELLNLAEWFGQSVQNRGYAFYGKLLTIVISAYRRQSSIFRQTSPGQLTTAASFATIMA